MSAQSNHRKYEKKSPAGTWGRVKIWLAVALLAATAVSVYAYSQFFIFGQPVQLEAMEIRAQVEENVLLVDGSLTTDSLVFAKAEPQQTENQVVIQVNTALPSSVCRDRKRSFQCKIPLEGVQEVLVQGQQQICIWSREGGVQP